MKLLQRFRSNTTFEHSHTYGTDLFLRALQIIQAITIADMHMKATDPRTAPKTVLLILLCPNGGGKFCVGE